MPVYKKKETSHRTTLSWDGYTFPWGVEVETLGYVRPHAELELVSNLPAPPSLIMLQEEYQVAAGEDVIVEVPACEEYIVSIGCSVGKVTCYPNTEDTTPVLLEKDQRYYTQLPIRRSMAASWILRSEAGATCDFLIEFIK